MVRHSVNTAAVIANSCWSKAPTRQALVCREKPSCRVEEGNAQAVYHEGSG